MANLPTYGRNETTITARESDVALADFDDGLNLGASNAPGLGIATDVVNPKSTDWSVNDSFGNDRIPQNTMHLGGDGTNSGATPPPGGTHPIQVADYVAVDLNDTANYLAATQQAAPGAVMDATSGAVNRSSQTVEIGDEVWATVPVA